MAQKSPQKIFLSDKYLSVGKTNLIRGSKKEDTEARIATIS